MTLNWYETFSVNFPKKIKFKFIQIGGNDGKSFDDLYFRILERESEGIILEPSKKYFSELKNTYKNLPSLILLQNAIFEKDANVKLYEINELGLSKLPKYAKGIGSFNKDHLIKEGVQESEIDCIEVVGITFKSLLQTYPNFEEVNYLQIDTEGYDFEILKMIDFKKFKTSIIKFEILNLSSGDKKKALDLLEQKGFRVFYNEMDAIGLKPELNFFLKHLRPS